MRVDSLIAESPSPCVSASHPDRNTDVARLSVVIPTLNEEVCIGRTLDAVRDGDVWETIVVDGGSRDRTREIARSHGATVVRSEPGRGRQLNVGANAAAGDTLLFLHADTIPPPNFESDVFQVLGRPDIVAGAFRLKIDAPHFSLRIVERLVNLRSTYMQLPYGDQGIFMSADVFGRLGGFPNVSVMEDYEFVRRLRKLGRIAIAPSAVNTSARRWLRRGIARATLANQFYIAAYHVGINPDRIAAWRSAKSR